MRERSIRDKDSIGWDNKGGIIDGGMIWEGQ
jgi:hypothetical protein